MDAVQGQPRPDRSMESTTGLTLAGDCVTAQMSPIRPRRRSPECPWGGADGRERGRAGPGCPFSPRLRVQLPGKRTPAGRRWTARGQGDGDAGECKLALCSPADSHHALRREMFPGDVDGTGPPVPCRFGNSRSAGRSDPSNSHRYKRGESGAPTRPVQAGPWPRRRG